LADPTIAAQGSNERRTTQRILIVRLGAMGDVLHALPAVELLRQALPDSEIGWVVERRWVPLLCANGSPLSGATSAMRPLVNNVHVVDTRAWRKSMLSSATIRSIATSISGVRARQYSVALDFQGAIKSAVIARISGSSSIVGFEMPREYAASMFYSRRISASMPHVVDQNLALARDIVRAASTAPTTSLPYDAAAEAWVNTRLAELQVTRFAILAPTAGWKAKEWPAGNFGAVASALAERGIASLINFGPGEEAAADEVRVASSHSAIPFACDLSQLIALTRRAAIFIGGDTGPMHLAASLNVPVIALFGPTDPARNGPYAVRAKILRSAKSVTSYSHVAQRDEGLASITAGEVVSAVDDLLAGSND
jgi:heptosyltransferase-1